jgi:hypothetical protein
MVHLYKALVAELADLKTAVRVLYNNMPVNLRC